MDAAAKLAKNCIRSLASRNLFICTRAGDSPDEAVAAVEITIAESIREAVRAERTAIDCNDLRLRSFSDFLPVIKPPA